MNARKQKKNIDLFLQKTSIFGFQRKNVSLMLFKFQKQFMIDTGLIKLTQFEKTGSMIKNFILMGKLKIQFYF